MTAMNDRAAWARKGECNNCGYCCRFSFDPLQVVFPLGVDLKRDAFLRVRGFVEAREGGAKVLAKTARVYDRCQYHSDVGCGIFGRPERPAMCSEFPVKPSQVIGTPCSYWFEDPTGSEAPVGGDGSPHGQLVAHEDVTTLEGMGM